MSQHSMNTRIPTPETPPLSQPRAIPGLGESHFNVSLVKLGPLPRKVFTAENNGLSSSDEDRTHSSVLSRRSRKRRRTTTSFDGASNPSREVMASLAGSYGHSAAAPYSGVTFPNSPPLFGFENEGSIHSDDDDEHMMRRRKSISLPDSDMVARQRCYEYLHSAIDAVWAEYCDSTSQAERQKYMPHSPVSETEDPMFSGFASSGGESWLDSPRSRKSFGSDQSWSKDRKCGGESISQQPESQSLMRQKKKLLDAKYFLGYIVSSQDMHDSARFWRTWDQLKYSTVELVEGDDEEADEVIEDLEAGRF